MTFKTLLFPIALMGLFSCVYITQDEYDGLADYDGDTFDMDVDCNDNDHRIYPENEDEVFGDGVDSDCDGDDGAVCGMMEICLEDFPREDCSTVSCTKDEHDDIKGLVATCDLTNWTSVALSSPCENGFWGS